MEISSENGTDQFCSFLLFGWVWGDISNSGFSATMKKDLRDPRREVVIGELDPSSRSFREDAGAGDPKTPSTRV